MPSRSRVALLCAVPLLLTGCGLENDSSRAFYVPLAPSNASTPQPQPAPTEGMEPPSPSPSESSYSVRAAWRGTCRALDEFKSTYAATFIFSVTSLEIAAKASPSRQVKADLRVLSEALRSSEEEFSRALATEAGRALSDKVAAECGEPLTAVPPPLP